MQESVIPTSNPRANYLAHKEEIDAAIHAVLDGGQYMIGDAVEKFETEFAEYCFVKHAIGVGSGTDAIEMILRALGIGPGDEVITTPFTATGTVAPIKLVWATPVYAGVNYNTGLINPKEVEEKITGKTKAILPVHLYGQICEMPALAELAEYYGLYLIEDACQAHGAWYSDRDASAPAGAWGIAGAFSFYPTKNLSCLGDGGAITTSNDKLADKLRRMRFYDWDYAQNAQSVCGQSRLDAIQAAVLSVKLKYLDEENNRRRVIADMYSDKLKKYDADGICSLSVWDITLPRITTPGRASSKHVFHQYVVKTNMLSPQKFFAEHGVQIGKHYRYPVNQQRAYQASGSFGDFFSARISLPMFPEMTEADVQKVVDAFDDYRRMVLSSPR